MCSVEVHASVWEDFQLNTYSITGSECSDGSCSGTSERAKQDWEVRGSFLKGGWLENPILPETVVLVEYWLLEGFQILSSSSIYTL